jgi:2-succinyl-6-hydroxy-2,4-cyclohexadiene-1-carboxylate synthase
MAGAAADVAALARHVNAGAHPPVVLGYSMGGRLALYAALEHPSAFAALVLESASPGLKTEAERAERRAADERLAVMLETDGLAVFVEHWERLPLFASQARIAPEARAAVRERRLRGDAAGWAASLRGMGTGAQPSMWERLGEWAKPTLLLTGRDDAKFTALADAMQAAGLRAEHTVFEAAGHAVHVEQPAAWAARVSAFVRDALGA